MLSESSIGLPSVTQWHGGTDVLVGARLGRFADGSLAIGQWTRVSGRSGSIGWGDTSFLMRRKGDRVVWHWKKLARIGASGEGIAPTAAEKDRARRQGSTGAAAAQIRLAGLPVGSASGDVSR